ncbi:hypothetical protein MMC29_005057 [Sticta canariensis]|nr:hypothetical protein [Sticta canariensis]
MIHTLVYNRKAQSAWDPMPEDMRKEYLDIIAKIPFSFLDIVEEYLPGVFDPIRRHPDAIGPLPMLRWYPKPILIAAAVFAERRILDDSRVTQTLDEDSNWNYSDDHSDEDSDEDSDERSNEDSGEYSGEHSDDNSDENSDDRYADSNIVGTNLDRRSANRDLYNRYVFGDQSDSESNSSCNASIRPNIGLNSDNYSGGSASTCADFSDSASHSDGGASTCADFSNSYPDNVIISLEDADGDSEDGDGDLNGSSDWDMLTINQEFQVAQDELEQHGFEISGN